jgi:hypothetical protein
MGDIGLEQLAESSEKTRFVVEGGAQTGALEPGLAFVVGHWDRLTDDDRRRISAIVAGRLA